MSKRRRSAPASGDRDGPARARGPRPDELGREGALGNQAVQQGIDHTPSAPGLDVVRDVALPSVRHAQLALELRPMPADRLARLVAIVEASALGGDRRAELAGRLQADQHTALAVGQAVERALGVPDSPEARSRAVEALAAVTEALSSGQPDGDVWAVGEQRVAVDAGGSLGDRADALVAGVAEAVAGPHLGGAGGDVIVGLCRSIQLAVLLDEEEEEGPTPGSYDEEQSGW